MSSSPTFLLQNYLLTGLGARANLNIINQLDHDTIENYNKKEPLQEASYLRLKANPIEMTWRDRETLFGFGFFPIPTKGQRHERTSTNKLDLIIN